MEIYCVKTRYYVSLEREVSSKKYEISIYWLLEYFLSKYDSVFEISKMFQDCNFV